MIHAHPTLRGAYRLTAEFWSPQPVEEVYRFFADAHNLEELTPPFLHFQVLTPAPITMFVGTTIDYQLRLRGIPVRWKSLISAWQPPCRFVDEQIVGPYTFWHHEHTFEAVDGGTMIRDVVDYGVPGGSLVHAVFVKRDLQKIFEYRRQKMMDRFGQPVITGPKSRLDSRLQTLPTEISR